MQLDGLGDMPALTHEQFLALPWNTVYVPGQTKIYRHMTPQESAQHYTDPNMATTFAFGPGVDIARAHGYGGPILDTSPGAAWQQISYGESSEYVRDFAAIHPQLQAWLDAKGYVVKTNTQTGGKEGVNYVSFWKDGKMVGVNGVGWSNKPGFMHYLVGGFLAAVTGGAALTAMGVIGAGAGAAGGAASGGAAAAGGGAAAAGGGVSATTVASGAATAAKALLPAASAAAPAVAAAAPAVSAGSALVSAATAAIPVVAKTIAVAAPVIKAQQERKAKETLVRAQMESQMPVAPPAQFVSPQVTYPQGLAPGQQPMYQALPSTTPPWLIPAAIGGAVLLLLMLRPQTAAPAVARRAPRRV